MARLFAFGRRLFLLLFRRGEVYLDMSGGIGRAGSGRFGQVRAQLNPGRIGQVQPEPRPNLPEPA